jgi:hypothetical protein
VDEQTQQRSLILHALNIAVGSLSFSWQFLFREKEKAQKFYDQMSHSPSQSLSIADDFGQAAIIHPPFNAMLENLDESRLAHVEMALHRTRIQVQAQKQAQSDPVLRAARPGAGPGVITPAGLQNGFQG